MSPSSLIPANTDDVTHKMLQAVFQQGMGRSLPPTEATVVETSCLPALDDPLWGQILNVHKLFAAVEARDVDQVVACLAAGVAVNSRNGNQDTPLTRSIARHDHRLVEVLIKHGADLEILDKDGYRPLHSAVMGGEPKLLAQLISAGAKIDGRSPRGETALHLAALWRMPTEVDVLLNFGAQVNCRDRAGVTALMHAAAVDEAGIVEKLLNHGADPWLSCRKGLNSFAIARERMKHGHGEVLAALERFVLSHPDTGQLTCEETSEGHLSL